MVFRLLLLLPALLLADPFGKDADLAHAPHSSTKSAPNGALYEKLIHFHQEVISPADGPRSHFYPSSSQYTLQAMRKYGFYQGFLMGCDRLQRENDQPWLYKKGVDGRGRPIKLDPVR